MPIRNVNVTSGGYKNPSLNLSYVPDLAGVDQNVLTTRRMGQAAQMDENKLNAYAADRAYQLKQRGQAQEDRVQRMADEKRQRKWDAEDRKTNKETMALTQALKAGDPNDARNIYKKFNPEDKSPPAFSYSGENIVIDGGPGDVKIEGPSAAVEMVLKELEKYPEIQKNPEHLKLFLQQAAKMGVSITKNDVSKTGWKPQSKQDAIDVARAKKAAGTDKTQARIDRLRKEVPRLAKLREDIRKGDKMDQLIKMMSPELQSEMGFAGNETKEEAIAKIDAYEKWIRTQLRGIELKGSPEDPLGLK